MAREPRIFPVFSPTVNEVVPFVDLGHKQRNISRVVLQVAIDRHDHLAASVFQPALIAAVCPYCGDSTTQPWVCIDQLGKRAARAVCGTVVHGN